MTNRRIPEADPYLLPLAALLTGWGILTIYRLVPAFRFPPDDLVGGLWVGVPARPASLSRITLPAPL